MPRPRKARLINRAMFIPTNGRGAFSNFRLIWNRLSPIVWASGMTAINAIVRIAGAASSNPRRASAYSWVLRRGLAANTRLAALENLARHSLAESVLYGWGRHVWIVRRHRTRLQIVK